MPDNVIIDVKRLVPLDKLDLEDLSSDGTRCAISGKYWIYIEDDNVADVDDEDKALGIDPVLHTAEGVFHEKIGIANLDNYKITSR